MRRELLVTGADGFIGSELARQVALHCPRKLVILYQAETDLFYLEMEFHLEHPELDLVPVTADVVDEATVRQVFATHHPDLIFHAAAYTHVRVEFVLRQCGGSVDTRVGVRSPTLGAVEALAGCAAPGSGRRGDRGPHHLGKGDHQGVGDGDDSPDGPPATVVTLPNADGGGAEIRWHWREHVAGGPGVQAFALPGWHSGFADHGSRSGMATAEGLPHVVRIIPTTRTRTVRRGP